jgi:REP element-mobilizing transposase RayT
MPIDRKYVYRRRLPHIQGDGELFVTFDTFHHIQLSPEERDIVLDCCRIADGRTVDLQAVVVMPDHVHILFTPREDDHGEPYSIPEIMQAIKGAAAHRVNRLRARSGPLFQAESFDHIPRSVDRTCGFVEYIRFNPVWTGLVRHPDDYRWTWVKK